MTEPSTPPSKLTKVDPAVAAALHPLLADLREFRVVSADVARNAFSVLMLSLAPPIRARARRLGLPLEVEDSVVARVFTALVKKLPDLPRPSDVTDWVASETAEVFEQAVFSLPSASRSPRPRPRRLSKKSQRAQAELVERMVALLTKTGARSAVRLTLRIFLPEGAEPDRTASLLTDLFRALNGYHIAAGGSGLEIDEWEIYERQDTELGVLV
jgi:hypothetical protein